MMPQMSIVDVQTIVSGQNQIVASTSSCAVTAGYCPYLCMKSCDSTLHLTLGHSVSTVRQFSLFSVMKNVKYFPQVYTNNIETESVTLSKSG